MHIALLPYRLLVRRTWLRMLLVWVLILLTCSILSMTLGELSGVFNMQQKLSEIGLDKWAYISGMPDNAGEKYDGTKNPAWVHITKTLESMPGSPQIINSLVLFPTGDSIFNDVLIYPHELANDISLPLSAGSWTQQDDSTTINAILDSRTRSIYTIGDTFSLNVQTYDAEWATDITVRVAGFLDEDNTHIDIRSSQTTTFSGYLLTVKPTQHIIILIDDVMLANPRLAPYHLASRFIKPRNAGDIEKYLSTWKDYVYENGIGTVMSLEDIFNNDEEEILSFAVLQLSFSGLMLLLVFFGMGGIQDLLFEERKKVIASFRIMGMPERRIVLIWITHFLITILIPSLAGAFLGKWLYSFLMFGYYPYTGTWPVFLTVILVVIVNTVGILPTLRRIRKIQPQVIWQEAR